MNYLVDTVMAKADWSHLRTGSGFAAGIPGAISDLSRARDRESAEAAYWKIDNEVVVQGQLYQAAVPTLQVLFLLLPTLSSVAGRRCAVELIQQIVWGESHRSEVEVGRADLGERCRLVATGALWLLYNLLLDPDEDVRECALLTLDRVETDLDRKMALVRSCIGNDGSERVLRTARRIVDGTLAR